MKESDVMNPITYQEAVAALRRAGFLGPEIERLYRLRCIYRTSEWDQPALDLGRLRFARWLVTTGLLTDWPLERARRCLLLPLRSGPACKGDKA